MVFKAHCGNSECVPIAATHTARVVSSHRINPSIGNDGSSVQADPPSIGKAKDSALGWWENSQPAATATEDMLDHSKLTFEGDPYHGAVGFLQRQT